MKNPPSSRSKSLHNAIVILAIGWGAVMFSGANRSVLGMDLCRWVLQKSGYAPTEPGDVAFGLYGHTDSWGEVSMIEMNRVQLYEGYDLRTAKDNRGPLDEPVLEKSKAALTLSDETNVRFVESLATRSQNRRFPYVKIPIAYVPGKEAVDGNPAARSRILFLIIMNVNLKQALTLQSYLSEHVNFSLLFEQVSSFPKTYDQVEKFNRIATRLALNRQALLEVLAGTRDNP